ncbi:hypothetical protein FOA52_006608 [Chlamydomonas sp. UWO 241]|nr:hypothetical protein FOA52_006608 [Chlamydomonas sp. UWO 241]
MEDSAPVASYDAMEANPFNAPGDEEIFRHREDDKARRAMERTEALSRPLADKSTFASRMQTTTTADTRELLRKMRAGGPGAGPSTTAVK